MWFERGEFSTRLSRGVEPLLPIAVQFVVESLEGDPATYIGEYYSTLEEARADLVALWNFFDPKLVEMGVAPDLDVGRAGYDRYIRGGLTQHRSVPEGDQFEEDHDR